MRSRTDCILYVNSNWCMVFPHPSVGGECGWDQVGDCLVRSERSHNPHPTNPTLTYLFHSPSLSLMSSVSLARILYRGILTYIFFLLPFPV